jgi:hypothetical protein
VSTEIGHGLRADVPVGWTCEVIEGRMIEFQPPSRSGAAHISVVRRRLPEPPTEDEARDLLGRVPVWRNRTSSGEPTVSSDGAEIRAFGKCVGPEGHAWDVGVLMMRNRAAVYTFNSEVVESPERAEAREIFASIEGLDT